MVLNSFHNIFSFYFFLILVLFLLFTFIFPRFLNLNFIQLLKDFGLFICIDWNVSGTDLFGKVAWVCWNIIPLLWWIFRIIFCKWLLIRNFITHGQPWDIWALFWLQASFVSLILNHSTSRRKWSLWFQILLFYLLRCIIYLYNVSSFYFELVFPLFTYFWEPWTTTK